MSRRLLAKGDLVQVVQPPRGSKARQLMPQIVHQLRNKCFYVKAPEVVTRHLMHKRQVLLAEDLTAGDMHTVPALYLRLMKRGIDSLTSLLDE